MKYTQPVYRPPYEANSLLLQVTVGCAHNKCTHCSMYRDVKFSTETFNQIEQDLIEAKEMYGSVSRFFLVNGDAFVLSANKLKHIAKRIIHYFPEVEVITMYASISNVKSKTDQELRELHDLRINELWMGIESGNAETLEHLNVGYTLDDVYIQLERLNKAGLEHIDNFILGAGGRGNGIRNAADTAKLVNKTKTIGLSVTTLGVHGTSPLAEEVRKGLFLPATEREILEEQKRLIELVDIDTTYLGAHGINTVAFDVKLPTQRDLAMAKINDALAKLDNKFLDNVSIRNYI